MAISGLMNRGFIARVALVVAASMGLGACGALQQSEIFQENFWASSPIRQNDEAELGIAELAKGNFVAAESHFQKALRANPRDVDALLGSGILYQNTGQITKSREMYEAVLAIRPDEGQQFVVWNNLSTRPASQIASVNLSLLDSGETPSAVRIGQPPAGFPGAPQTVAAQPTGRGGPVQPQIAPAYGQPQMQRAPQQQSMAMTAAMSEPVVGFSGGMENIVARFSTMRALRDQGLLTPEEFRVRRQANIGSILPLTSPPPSAGLDRSVPTTEQISGRLRAIGRALELRAISVSQHAAERNMILDALMPAAPVRLTNPAAPPGGLLEAADSVRRLEQLRDGGFISSDEYTRERQAIEKAMAPAAPQMAKADPKMLMEKDKKEAEKPKGPQPGVHLASYRSEKQAEAGWKTIQRRHQSALKDLEHEVAKVDLGKKGTYYRLKAGPLKSEGDAKKLCGDLKKRRQFCEPTTVGG
ncbi:MAG: SHOCT domain-containing protein [Rhodospirillaceae bacterium]